MFVFCMFAQFAQFCFTKGFGFAAIGYCYVCFLRPCVNYLVVEPLGRRDWDLDLSGVVEALIYLERKRSHKWGVVW